MNKVIAVVFYRGNTLIISQIGSVPGRYAVKMGTQDLLPGTTFATVGQATDSAIAFLETHNEEES